MEAVYEIIFSYSGRDNFFNGRVCSLFRRLAPKMDGYDYVEQLLQDKVVLKNLVPCKKLAKVAYERELINLLDFNAKYVSEDVCRKAARKGKFAVLRWALERGVYYCQRPRDCTNCRTRQGSTKSKICPHDALICSWTAAGGHLEIIKWARENGTVSRNVKFYVMLRIT